MHRRPRICPAFGAQTSKPSDGWRMRGGLYRGKHANIAIIATALMAAYAFSWAPSVAMAQTAGPDTAPTGIDMIPTDLPAHASSITPANRPTSLLPGTIPAKSPITEETEIPSLADQYQRSINGQPPIRRTPKQSTQPPATTVRALAPKSAVDAASAGGKTPKASPALYHKDGGPLTAPAHLSAEEIATPAATGRYLIQLGAFRDVFTAETYWASFSIRYPELVASYKKQITAANLGSKGVYHRLQLVGFDNAQSAHEKCRQLKADGTDCFAKKR